MEPRLLPDRPVEDLDHYRSLGGGEGLDAAKRIGPDHTIETVRSSGLRGRGGAGFPTGIKWSGIAGDRSDGQTRYVVCNAAEGEPGTFKDRAVMRVNPHAVVEGIAIAALAVGAAEAHIGIKASYDTEIARLGEAAVQMNRAGWLDGLDLRITEGPDDYLLGEEKALLEVIEGRDPLPRLYPPYVVGLGTGMSAGLGAGSAGPSDRVNPTLVNNVETLANVPALLARGPEWFRSVGTERSPGTMVFTISGDVRTPTVAELPLGTPLSILVYGVGGGLEAGRRVASVWSGVSNAPLNAAQVDTPLSFEAMELAGSGLGSGGLSVYDDTSCIADVAQVMSTFLAVESCGQCPPCKLGTASLADDFASFHTGEASYRTLEEMTATMQRVTDANRCGLGAGQQAVAAGVLARFADDLERHLTHGCHTQRRVRLPKLLDLTTDGFTLA
jgi:NADH-quinone oxidoreductase subunit F